MKYPLVYPFHLSKEKADIILKAYRVVHAHYIEHNILEIHLVKQLKRTGSIFINCYGVIYFDNHEIGYLINANTFKLYQSHETKIKNRLFQFGHNLPRIDKSAIRKPNNPDKIDFANQQRIRRLNKLSLNKKINRRNWK